jgi:outer membrane biosynthesis protein TonB
MYIVSADAQSSTAVPLSGNPVMLGSLVSNQLIVDDPDADAIHCMIEQGEDGILRLTDLNSKGGVWLNGHRIDVEATLKHGDLVRIGTKEYRIAADYKPQPEEKPGRRTILPFARKRPLFQHTDTPPATAHTRVAADRRLEVVAYWGNTVLNVDHFHPEIRGYSDVTIGDPEKSHFISGDKNPWASWVLAQALEDSYVLKLQDGMRAHVRARGVTTKLRNKSEIILSEKDFAHIRHGVVDYFIRYVHAPNVRLPDRRTQNKVLTWTGFTGALLYFVLIAVALTVQPNKAAETLVETPPTRADERWQIVDLNESFPVKPERVPPEVKKPVKTTPVKPDKIVKAVPPVQSPVKKTAPQPVKQETPSLNNKLVEKALPLNTPSNTNKPVSKPAHTTTSAAQQIATAIGSQKLPAMTAPGAPGQKVPALSGGPLKGANKTDKPGVEGQTGKQAAFTDLKSLGGKLGPVLSSNAPGGVRVDFRSTGGGQGGKEGTAAKDYNLGGPGTNGSIAIPGSGGRIGNWGDNPSAGGGLTGSLSSSSLFPGKNHSTVALKVAKPQDPVSQVSLTMEEVYAVIRQNLNQLRHCYEQTLQRSPHAAGTIKVRFAIVNGGRVSGQTVIHDSLGDVKMNACVLEKIARWKFPEPRAGALNVSYPFNFNPQM